MIRKRTGVCVCNASHPVHKPIFLIHSKYFSVLFTLGPFEICHEFVDSTPFYESCVYDMCVTKQVNSFCNALYEYSEACRMAGGKPGTWWEEIRECGN